MDVSTEQCYTIKFCVRLKKLIMETITLLKEVFQNKTLHYSIIHRWHKAFTDDRESAEIEHIGGRLRTVETDVTINTVSVVTEEDHYLSI